MALTKVTPFMIADSFPDEYQIINIPSDYATLQAAFDDLVPGVFKSGQYYDIVIESGHALTTGLDLSYGDYSHFRISSVDATVTLAPSFAYVDSTYRAVMRVTYAKAPQWNILVDCGAQIGRALMYLNGSSGYVYANKGAINATYFGAVDNGAGLYANGGCSIYAPSSNFSYCSRGAWLARGVIADFDSANLSHSTFIGLYASRGVGVGAESVNVSYCPIGVDSNRSMVMAANANGDNSSDRAFLAENAGILDITGASAQTATNYGVSAENSGIIHARNVNATGAGLYGFRTTVGGKLDITGATGTSSYVENLQIAAGLTTNNGAVNPLSVSASVMSVDVSAASVFKAETYRSGNSFTLSNDTATSFSIPLVGSDTSEWGTLIISSSATGNGHPNGIIRYRVGTSPATNNISLITTTNVTLTTGVLTGTTGSVGDFTISAATDAKLYFENRTGSSVSFRIMVTG